jgi:riboflavin transporter FmnP
MYLGDAGVAVFLESFWFIVAFNLIKTASIGILPMLLYKRLSTFLKKWEM